ncbi:MAG: hypothetical protein H7Y43_00585 [Akkermansiaceae bacterium]|nr:hypothetical protein [Verrucomicrobiales bacterium]
MKSLVTKVGGQRFEKKRGCVQTSRSGASARQEARILRRREIAFNAQWFSHAAVQPRDMNPGAISVILALVEFPARAAFHGNEFPHDD